MSLWRSFREFREMAGIYTRVALFKGIEEANITLRYYPNLSFAKVDAVLKSFYFGRSPFHYSKEYLQKVDSDDFYQYGETPLTTLEKIAKEAEISDKDVVYELGCGRGRTCFWLQKVIGCRVVGIDIVPAFIQKADQVADWCAADNIEFREEDFLKSDLSDATVIYLYGTCYGDRFIKDLIERFRELPAGTRIITVSYPLTDYTDESLFEVMNVHELPFTWGKANVYIQYRL